MAEMKVELDKSELDAAVEKADRLLTMLDEIEGRFAALGGVDKVRISRIEINGDGADCRVVLSDGKELDGWQRIAPGDVTPDDFLTVQIDAIIGPSD